MTPKYFYIAVVCILIYKSPLGFAQSILSNKPPVARDGTAAPVLQIPSQVTGKSLNLEKTQGTVYDVLP